MTILVKRRIMEVAKTKERGVFTGIDLVRKFLAAIVLDDTYHAPDGIGKICGEEVAPIDKGR